MGSSPIPKGIEEGPQEASVMAPGGFALALVTAQQETCALDSLFLRKIPLMKSLDQVCKLRD